MTRTQYLPLLLFSIGCLRAFDGASPFIDATGGITVNGTPQAFLFTWNAPVPIVGSGWSPGETVSIVLNGPLNSPGVAASDVPLGTLTADGQGNLSGSLAVPYDSGVTGAAARIPRPGLYGMNSTGSVSGFVIAPDFVLLCPATHPDVNTPFDWGHERGARDGILPGQFRVFSPERFDPEWISAWDERPVEVYGTVAAVGTNGDSQPSRISYTDNPATHYGHDGNFFLVPDGYYLWLIGTANYYAGEPNSAETGRLEIEWETQNGGSASRYAQGNIGAPLFVNPTEGDRMYVVGRWILDAGHPELGDRTEIHPPRLMATMRQRPVLASSGAGAAQVDIFVSGHGGGANQFPLGLSAQLNQNGYGGGRIRDLLSSGDQQVYYRAGPIPGDQAGVIIGLIQFLTGQTLDGPIYAQAGPSAFSWGSQAAPEEHPINDMDYDFDVPLPPPPAGATTVNVEVTTQPQHTTAVSEVITYTNPVNGLPTTAHVHLPYNGADNRVYARTLKFFWDTASPPANHFQVSLNRVSVKDTAGAWQLWADISGQWNYLTGLDSDLLKTAGGQALTLPANQFDVYLGPNDPLRILVQGYRAVCLDGYFGTLFGLSSYTAGLKFLVGCGPNDNDDLGGALLELPPLPASQGTYQVQADHFQVDVTVNYAPR